MLKSNRLRFANLCWLFFIWSATAMADFRDGEANLYPAGSSTADVLQKQEWFLAPQGWVAYGLSERFTIVWDWFLVFGGIPAGQLRWSLTEPSAEKTQYAIEAYGVYFPEDISDSRDKNFKVNHRGGGGITYLRLSRSQNMTSNSRLHLSAGATYNDYEEFEPRKDSSFQINRRRAFVTPDWGLTIETDVNPKFKVNLAATSGNTFVLFDQISQKWMINLGLQWAPFQPQHRGYLSNLRIELISMLVRIKNADYEKFYPLYPVVYWQWTPE